MTLCMSFRKKEDYKIIIICTTLIIIIVTRYEKTCLKLLFINGTLALRSIQRRKKNEVCTIFRSGAMDVYSADARESRRLGFSYMYCTSVNYSAASMKTMCCAITARGPRKPLSIYLQSDGTALQQQPQGDLKG